MMLMNIQVPNYVSGSEVVNKNELLNIDILPRISGIPLEISKKGFPFIYPKCDEGISALTRWVTGMQAWYLNGIFAVEAAQNAVKSLQKSDVDIGINWIDRMLTLSRSGVSLNKITSNMPKEHYIKHVRTAESQYREDFFGGSFREWWLFKALSFRVCDLVLGRVPEYSSLIHNKSLKEMRIHFQKSGSRYWFTEHEEIRTRLVGKNAPSLAHEKYNRDKSLGLENRTMKEIIDHLQTNVNEFHYHDTFFGVERVENINIETFKNSLTQTNKNLDELVNHDYDKEFYYAANKNNDNTLFQDFILGRVLHRKMLAEISG